MIDDLLKKSQKIQIDRDLRCFRFCMVLIPFLNLPYCLYVTHFAVRCFYSARAYQYTRCYLKC